MKKKLRELYLKVGHDSFCNGIKNCATLILLVVIVILLSGILGGCNKEPEIYEVVQAGTRVATADREKIPYTVETKYIIIKE